MIYANLDDVMGDDLKAVRMAKVSFDDDETVVPFDWYEVQVTDKLLREQPILTDPQKRLIQYLARGMTNKDFQKFVLQVMLCSDTREVADMLWTFRNTPTHAAPFGHSFMTYLVEAPVFVARQLVKHEYLRMSEVSRRYVKGEPLFWKPEKWSSIAEDVKQGSGEPLDNRDNTVANHAYDRVISLGSEAYEFLCGFVSPEEARSILPLCHMTRWYWSGSLDAFANMCNLRLGDDTQSQTRIIAEDVSRQSMKAFPVSWTALVEGNNHHETNN